MRSAADRQLTIARRGRLSSSARPSMTVTRLVLMLATILVGLMLSACVAGREQTKSPRAPIEQLLLSRSLERSLYDLQLPILQGARVVMETEGLPPDLSYVKTLVAEQLGLQDAQISENKAEAQYVVKVIVHALGTEQATTLVGMPEVQGGLFPIALPELALYKEQLQSGYARLSLAIYDRATGALKESVTWRTGSAYYNFYTVLFWFTFPATDLVLPPTPASGFDYSVQRSTYLIAGPEDDHDETVPDPAR